MKWRMVVALALAYVAAGGPLVPRADAPRVVRDEPAADMKALVGPVATALANAPAGDRMLWAELFEKMATVVAGDATSTEPVFSDTRALRAFTVLSLEIGWRRLGDHEPGYYPGLRAAVETALGSAVTLDVAPVDAAMRTRYVEACRAIAWAGWPGRG